MPAAASITAPRRLYPNEEYPNCVPGSKSSESAWNIVSPSSSVG